MINKFCIHNFRIAEKNDFSFKSSLSISMVKFCVAFVLIQCIFVVLFDLNNSNATNLKFDINVMERSKTEDLIFDSDCPEMNDFIENCAGANPPLANLIDSKEGSVILSVKPEYSANDKISHVIMSQKQVLSTQSFILWDVPDKNWGGHRFFFEFGSLSMPFDGVNFLENNTWSHLGVTWKSGPNGYIRSFLNGEMVNHAPLGRPIESIRGKMVFGECKNTEPSIKLKKIKIYNRAVSSDEVAKMYCLDFLNSDYNVQTKKSDNTELIVADNLINSIEARILFDETPSFITDVDAVIRRLKAGNFNVYIPCIWYGGYARWNSKFEIIQGDYRRNSQLTKKDLLEDLIEKAHESGIQVHPWFCVSKREANRFPEFAKIGTPNGKYDIHQSAFRAYLIKLVTEVVENYNVDGINLDYVRSGGNYVTTSSLNRYALDTGRNLELDLIVSPDLVTKWQATSIDDLVRNLSLSVRMLKPNLIISVDSFPNPPQKLNAQGRNHKTWLENGWVDLVFYMCYGLQLPISELEQDIMQLANPNSGYPLIGNFDWTENNMYTPRQPDKLLRLIKNCRNKWPGVVGIYLYQQLDDSQIAALAAGPFKYRSHIDWSKILNNSVLSDKFNKKTN